MTNCIAPDCGDLLHQRPDEKAVNFKRRRTCGRGCANRIRVHAKQGRAAPVDVGPARVHDLLMPWQRMVYSQQFK